MPRAGLPDWASELVAMYVSGSANQFILYGNVEDRLPLPVGGGVTVLGNLRDFLLGVLMPGFDVVLSYDLGHGVRVEKGGPTFTQWPGFRDAEPLPGSPRLAVELLDHYFRYTANLARLDRAQHQVGCFIRAAHLVVPALQGGLSYDLNAMALLIRDWATDTLLTEHSLATFLITENLNDLHPMLAQNTRAARIKLPLPDREQIQATLRLIGARYPVALQNFASDLSAPAAQLAGTTLSALEGLLKTREHARRPLAARDLADLKKQLVEQDCSGLIEFIEPHRNLDHVYGQQAVKDWLRQDIALWQRGELQGLPMGYLLCGPVGTGKTFMVECLAGEAGVPVVKLKNFRDKWVGSTEGNLEKIFRLLQALGRCYVFVDEADQAVGRRGGTSGDSNVSGRVYSMLAEEMSDTGNRGKVVWVLASSRPDLIEVDLKRPGRVDIKIPLFPTSGAEEGFRLLQALCKARDVALADPDLEVLREMVPDLLTPGAAEAIAVKAYRQMRASDVPPLAALRESLNGYQSPVPREVMDFQIGLAAREASDIDFVPERFRSLA